MATISGGAAERVFRIAKFAGLNESQDGENNLEINEASYMLNCKVTKEKNLKKRPGTKTWIDISSSPIVGLWYGLVNGRRYFLCASGGSLYSLDIANKTKTRLGAVNTDNRVTFFAFQNVVYIMDGHNYKQWDGNSLINVVGYVPLVVIGCPPAGGGTLLEEINKLSASRRVWFSPDGTATIFQLPEKNLRRVDYVKDLSSNVKYPADAYAVNLTNGTVTFDGTATETFKVTASKRAFTLTTPNVQNVTEAKLGSTVLVLGTDYTFNATTKVITITGTDVGTLTVSVTLTTIPAQGTNTIEIGYTVLTDFRSQVCSMTNAEIFSGGTDAVVCIYGDGSNEFFYSSVDYDGQPRADYFPDMNEAAVGSSNSEITQLIRHQSRMMAYKPNETYSIVFGSETTATGLLKFTYSLVPINREKGNDAKGMAQLVDNAPRTLWCGDCYYWVNSSYYSSNLTADERQARICSNKVHDTLSSFDFSHCVTYDDNKEHEYWVSYGDMALVECYEKGVEAWYYYEGLKISAFQRIDNDLFIGTYDGKIKRLSDEYASDDDTAFPVAYETGAIDFGRPDYFKFINKIYVSIKPQGRGKVLLGVSTDKKIATRKKAVTSNILDFASITFGVLDKIEEFVATQTERSFQLLNSDITNIKSVTINNEPLEENVDYTYDSSVNKINLLIDVSIVGNVTVTENVSTESNSFTFETNDMPHTKRLKIKSKKFTYWKAMIELESTDESFTITNIAIPVRYTGAAK